MEENKISGFGTSIDETMSVRKVRRLNIKPEFPILQLAVV